MKRIEVEGKEIAIRNSHGDIAIVPIKDVAKVKAMMKRNCNECIDDYIETLPRDSDYAADGTLMDDTENK